MTGNPSLARELLGAELRRLREAVGLRVEDAAVILECSTAKISRLETGKGRPYFRDVRDLLNAYGPAALARIDEFRDRVEASSQPDWTDRFKDVSQAEDFSPQLALDGGGRFLTLERDATELRWYEPDFIPGLMQTPEYIDAIRRSAVPDQSVERRKRFVEFRLQRQREVLGGRNRPAITSVVSELAIVRRSITRPSVMKDQLQYIIDSLENAWSWVDFRITPLEREPVEALGGPFFILRFANPVLKDTVYLEGREEPDYLDAESDVERYEKMFDAILRSSLSRAASLRRLAAEVRSLAGAPDSPLPDLPEES
jgi:transcriptional regulator with XRE-family HTH domain